MDAITNNIVRLAAQKQKAPNPGIVCMLRGLLEQAEAGELDSLNCQVKSGAAYKSMSAGEWEAYASVTHDHFCNILSQFDREKREIRMEQLGTKARGKVVNLAQVQA
jgi:hypothetical protein